jgi:hypothetical protein
MKSKMMTHKIHFQLGLEVQMSLESKKSCGVLGAGETRLDSIR